MSPIELKDYAANLSYENPHLMPQIIGFYDLFLTEIGDEAASVTHEVELCYNSIEELLQENNLRI
jgi:hypothetical protein